MLEHSWQQREDLPIQLDRSRDPVSSSKLITLLGKAIRTLESATRFSVASDFPELALSGSLVAKEKLVRALIILIALFNNFKYLSRAFCPSCDILSRGNRGIHIVRECV